MVMHFIAFDSCDLADVGCAACTGAVAPDAQPTCAVLCLLWFDGI